MEIATLIEMLHLLTHLCMITKTAVWQHGNVGRVKILPIQWGQPNVTFECCGMPPAHNLDVRIGETLHMCGCIYLPQCGMSEI